MSSKYKFRDQDKLYFVSFATVYWLDIFIRNEYKEIILNSLRDCQTNGLRNIQLVYNDKSYSYDYRKSWRKDGEYYG